ncbi:MAG TPA: putative glycolipid-binding domain-containing protein [Pyrinomonadaceae bacterium]|nr:putative glycolipid-binding domain-containing protein [Pyrinomonadaceae bacterium]
MIARTILWRRIDLAGHEACRLYGVDDEWRLEGTAVFSHEDRACGLSYLIACDASWNTLSGTVSGWLGNKLVNIELAVDEQRRWKMNGVSQAQVDGCVDLDLNFSPATNLLPVRRLGLEVGESAEVKAAWLRFPSFELEPFAQVYTRVDESTYRYSSSDGEFVADLTVDDVGFATAYPGFWEAERSSE